MLKRVTFKQKECEQIDFQKAQVNTVHKWSEFDCKIKIKEESIEKLNDFKHLGVVLCKKYRVYGEIKEK